MSAAAGERTRSSRTATTVALATAALLICAFPASAGAAEATGNTTLVVAAGKKKQLDKRGVRIAGVRGAVTEGRRTRLQVRGGTVGSEGAVLNHRGALRVVAGKGRARRVVRLTALQTRLGAGGSVLRGKLNGRGKQRVLFHLRARPNRLALDGLRGTASLAGARLVWHAGAARALSRRLNARVPRGALGKVRTSAVARATDQPISGPVSSEPPLLTRPASAVDVTRAALIWHVRSSWINYVSGGGGTTAIEGATARDPVPETSHPCFDPNGPGDAPEASQIRTYSFSFPFANGWYDDASGTAALYGTGGLHFAYPGHGIDFATRNPEIEINGAASRAIFRLRGGAETAYPDQRAAILALAAPSPLIESPPGQFEYPGEAKSSLTPDGESVFTGFYTGANNGFGCFSVSFSTG